MKKVMLSILLFSTLAVAQEAAPPAPAQPPAELLEKPYLFEIARHLFRWYMDESDVEKLADIQEFPFRARRLDVKLDKGDRSQVAEITLPLLGIVVKVKKADYTIDEMGVTIRSPTFRIVNVARGAVSLEPAAGEATVAVGYAEMKDYLFRTRSQAEFPDEAMIERLRTALRESLKMDPNQREAGEHVVHLAPLSPVANELWVFIESKKMLVRFASDIDLENPGMWKHQSLAVRTYDILNQTVVSLNEAPGSNAFLTRDQVGRALFNCVVLGRRLVLVNPAAAPAGQSATPSPAK